MEKVETLKAGVRGKVSALQIVTLCGGKRPRSTPDTDLPPTKQPHIENPDSVPSPSPSTSKPGRSVVTTD